MPTIWLLLTNVIILVEEPVFLLLGATWYHPCPDVCVESEGYGSKVKDMWLQVNEMNEKISFNMGVKSAAPFHMRIHDF